MATVKELRAQAKARKIPKYYKLSKPQLMSALGVSNQTARPLGDSRARATAKQHGIAKTYAADKLSSKLGGSDEAKRVAIKQRIVKSVSKELKAHAKKIGRKLTIEEKRSAAVKAIKTEVGAIRRETRGQGGSLVSTRSSSFPAAASKAKRSKKSRADAYVPSSTQEAIAAKADAKKGKKKSKSEDAPLNDRDLKKAIYQRFEVKTQAQLLKSGNFKMATSGMAVKGKGFDPKSRESWEDVHRKTVGVLPEEKNETGPHVVNGINVMKYDMPWKAFGLNPKTATGEEIKRTAKKILAKHHPDNGGDPAVFDRLHQFYQSIKPREW